MTTTRASWGAAADPRRRIGHGVEAHDSIGSTNDRARALLAEPHGEGIAVVAELQTAGRGRHGRTWTSPAGRNLTVSVALRPGLAAESAWMLSATASLALRDACERTAGLPAGTLALKWPNDVVTTDGRKLAGILVETAIAADRLVEAVIGTGVNVNWPQREMPAEIAATAASLLDLAGAPLDRIALLAAYLDRLDAGVAALDQGLSPLEAYRAASWLDGRQVRVAVGDRETLGTVRGIGDGGALVLQTDAGELRLEHGEVLRVADGNGLPVA